MGNTVSAAERLASDIVHPSAAAAAANAHPHQPGGYSKDAVPPPECPMHQKDAAVPAAAPAVMTVTKECPLGHDKDEINPLNMVCG